MQSEAVSAARIRLQKEQTRLEEQLAANRAEQVRELRRKHEQLLENLKEQSAEHDRLLKERKEQELKQIEAQRRERSWQLEAEKQQEEKRLEDEFKKQSKLQQEKLEMFSAKQEKELALTKWKLREKESLAHQEIAEESKHKHEDITQWKLGEEEDIVCTSEWQRYATDKTTQIMTQTADMKIGAVERIEGKRLDVAASADTRRMDLYINAMEHSENLNEEERKQLDDILLDPSVFENQGAARTAVYQIEMDQPQMLHLTSSPNNYTSDGMTETNHTIINHQSKTTTTSSLFSPSQDTIDSTGGKLRKEEVKKRKLQVDKRCHHILTKTSQKVQSIEKSEITRLEKVDRSDKRSVTLLNKVITRGNFEPKFLVQIGQELTPIKASLQSTALQEVVNVQMSNEDYDSSSDDDIYYDCYS